MSTIQGSEPSDDWATLIEEIWAVAGDEPNLTARMATVVAMLNQAFDKYYWTGFYVVDPDQPEQLVVGPYQGTLGCLRIDFGRVVCGAAAQQRRTIIVPDVHAFDGHIACDSRSLSEIVTPVIDREGRLIAVLDVDSLALNDFTEADARGLQALVTRVFAN